MTSRYEITTQAPARPENGTTLFVQRAGMLCIAGGVIAVAGASTSGLLSSSVSHDQLSYPYTPGVFRVLEVLWAITHALTLFGAIGLARSGLAGSSRTSRIGLAITLAGMALLIPAELAFVVIATVRQDSTASIVTGSAIGLAAALAGIGFTVAGIGTMRAGLWAGWGRYTPLLCGLFVILVLIPLQGAVPAAFFWVIAGWNVCLALLGLALCRPSAVRRS